MSCSSLVCAADEALRSSEGAGGNLRPADVPSVVRDAAEQRRRIVSSIEKLLDRLEERDAESLEIPLIRRKLRRLLVIDVSIEDPWSIHVYHSPADYKEVYEQCADLSGDELRWTLHELISDHVPLGYTTARRTIFLQVDNHDGVVEGVYTGRREEVSGGIPSSDDMNIEHTWPQSHGAVGIAKSDLHHLFPTDSKANSIRGNLPFGMVRDPDWQQGGSKRGNGVFEVRMKHRGNVARAIFYFSVRYRLSVDDDEEAVLRRWAEEDPVDDAERARNDVIYEIQHNRNPFIDHPEFVKRIEDF